MPDTPKIVTGRIITGDIVLGSLTLTVDNALPGHEISLVEQTPAAVVVDLSRFDHVAYTDDGHMWCWDDLPENPDTEPRGIPDTWRPLGYIAEDSHTPGLTVRDAPPLDDQDG